MIHIDRDNVRLACVNCNKYYLKLKSKQDNHEWFCSHICLTEYNTKQLEKMKTTEFIKNHQKIISREHKRLRKIAKIERKKQKLLGKRKTALDRKQLFRERQDRIKNARLASAAFLNSSEWKRLRYEAILKYGRTCMCCGAKYTGHGSIHVDHIKPRATNPELSLNLDNLQILCNMCNEGKGAKYTNDWRN